MSDFILNTKVSIGETYGKQKFPNLTLEDAKFWGRPNFSGDPEADRFKDPRQKFTVQIPNDVADQLRGLGYNVKTTVPTDEEIALGREPISSLKVMVGKSPDIFVVMGQDSQKLNDNNWGMLDRSRIDRLDMEIRAWEFDPEDKPGETSARLVQLVAVITPNILQQKYGSILNGNG